MEQKFEFKGNLVRMKTDESEQYWFAGIDVCNILGLENPTQSVESLDEDNSKNKKSEKISRSNSQN